MCLIAVTKKGTYAKIGSRPYVAEADIIVYKILKRYKNRAPYRSKFEYQQGFHYYQDGQKFTTRRGDYGRMEVDQGLHSYRTLQKAKDKMRWNVGTGCKVVEMVIPKGSQYYLGAYGDIVSDNLIWY